MNTKASHRSLAILIVATNTFAQSKPTDAIPNKSGDHLFSPTPRELWRPLAADRPDSTESPITVDAGAFQLEASFAEIGLDREDGSTSTSLSIAPTNFKIGLTHNIDLQLLFNPWERIDQSGSNPRSGVGNFGIRAKFNLWGNDGGSTALALLPYVVFPTGDHETSGSAYQFGIVVPFAVELADGWSLGTQAQIVFVIEDGAKDTSSIAHTIVLGRTIAGPLAGYIEYIAEYTIQGKNEYQPTLSGGLTHALDPNTQLDLGLLVGLDNGDTQDLRLFAGITARF